MATVRFIDFSTNNPTGWSWDFDEGAVPRTASTKGPHLVEYSTGGTKTVSLTATNAAGSNTRVKLVPVTGPMPLTETFNAIIWDGEQFVIVGDNGTIATTVDGTSPIRRLVPVEAEDYRLTGVAYYNGIYVIVGTKTISEGYPGDYRLVILTSYDSITWAIDKEVDFTSYDDPLISMLDVFYGNEEFVIYGSTLNVIKGHPGSWSEPIPTHNPWSTTRGLLYKDGYYYEAVSDFNCYYTSLVVVQYDTSFNFINYTIVDTLMTSSSERLPFMYDTAKSLWVLAYHNEINTESEVDDKFTIATSPNLIDWSKEVDYLSTLIPGGICTLDSLGSYVVGGNSTTVGIVYSNNGSSWSNITSSEVSLNDVAFNGDSVVLAVGYHGAIVSLPIPVATDNYNNIAWCGSEFIIVGDEGLIVSTIDGHTHVHRSVPAGVSEYDLTGVAYNSGVYVVVGTKVTAPSTNRLLILTSSNGITWEIDWEVDFSIIHGSQARPIDVFFGNSEFVINGAMLHIIKGHPGEWSDPIDTQFYWMPTVGLIFTGGYYYEVVRRFDCGYSLLSIVKYDTSFNYIMDYSVDTLMTDDGNNRVPIFYDTARSRWVVPYHNEVNTESEVDDKFTISTSADLTTWVKEVEVSSTKLSNGSCFLSTVSGAYVVGGNLTTEGIIYTYNGAVWSDITTTEVSLNAVAYDGASLALAVGYQGTIVNLPVITPIVSYNSIVWDGAKFIIVGENGTVKNTTDGETLESISVPVGVEHYNLTGIAHHTDWELELEQYVIVGTKTVSAGNYRLLILTSTDSVTWTIDDEIDFASLYDPEISRIDVMYGSTEDGFIINGSTLQIIKGTPGSWSAPISVQYFDYIPIKSVAYKDNLYYIIFQDNACYGISLIWRRYDSNFNLVGYGGFIEQSYGGNYERCPFFYDTVRSLWTIAYYNSYQEKFVISTATDLIDPDNPDSTIWYKKVNSSSEGKYANGYGFVNTGSGVYIVGGNLAEEGALYSYNGALWSNITSDNVSLNAASFNGEDLVLAVGYHGAVVGLPVPTQISTVYNDVTYDGSVFIIVGSDGVIRSTEDGTVLTNITVPPGVSAYNLTGIAYYNTLAGPKYVVVGTKTISAGNYSLLILDSTDGVNWSIDEERPFASSYDPAISQIKVFWNNDSVEFFINGSTIQVIRGVPGDWSSHITLPGFDYLPLKSFIYKAPYFYAVFVETGCWLGGALFWAKYDGNFGALLDRAGIEFNVDFIGHDERCVFFWDDAKSLWVASYYNHDEGKLIISVSTDMLYWSRQMDVLTNEIPTCHAVSNTEAYISGGNSTINGVVYYRWSF